jgi:hypothetical protein
MEMPNKRLNIGLFSQKCEHTEEYRKLLSNFNVRVIEIGSEKFFQVILESIKCNGILLDIPAYVKSSPETREFAMDLGKIYPTARTRYNKYTESMELIVLEEKKQITLYEFLENRCRSFDARKLRTDGRMPLNLNTRLFLEQGGEQNEVLCSTSNISQNGLFLLHESDNFPVGAKVRIQILELGKDGFIHGTVTRSMKWGEKLFQAAGLGIRIDKMDKDIFDDYIELTRNL